MIEPENGDDRTGSDQNASGFIDVRADTGDPCLVQEDLDELTETFFLLVVQGVEIRNPRLEDSFPRREGRAAPSRASDACMDSVSTSMPPAPRRCPARTRERHIPVRQTRSLSRTATAAARRRLTAIRLGSDEHWERVEVMAVRERDESRPSKAGCRGSQPVLRYATAHRLGAV